MLKNKVIKLTIIVLSVIIGLWLLILVALQVLLKTSVIDKIIGKVATEFVDGDVHYSRVKINVVKSFPNLNVTIDSLSVTYPHDRWSCWDSSSVPSPMLSAGRGVSCDTLGAFETLSASIDYMALLRGKLHSRGAKLSGLKFYAHKYGDGQANWNMIRTSASDTTKEEAPASFRLPPISIGRIVLNHHPRIVYTAQEDTVFLTLDMNRAVLHGDLEKYLSDRELLSHRMDSLYNVRSSGQSEQRRTSRKANDLTQSTMASSIRRDSTSNRLDIRNSSIALHIDSVFVGGRLPSDTVGVFVNLFDVQDHGRRIAFEMDAKSMWFTRMFGRLRVPVHLSGEVGMEESRRHAGWTVYQLRQFNCSIAYVPVLMNAMVRRSTDSMYVNAALKIDNCHIGDILEKYGENISSSAVRFQTDASLTLTADCKGFVDVGSGLYPEASVALSIPEATVEHDLLPDTCHVALTADASLSEDGRLDATLRHLLLDLSGLSADFTGKASNLLSKDPLYSVKGKAETSLDELAAWLPDSVGPLYADGKMLLDINAEARQSQLSLAHLTQAKMKALLTVQGVDVGYPKLGLVAVVDSMTLTVNDMKGLVDSTARALGTRLFLDSLSLSLGENLALRGRNMRLMGNLTPKKVDSSVPLPEFKGKLAFDHMEAMGKDSARVRLVGMDNIFTVDRFVTPRMHILTPRLSLTSKLNSASARIGDNRMGVREIDIRLAAAKRLYNSTQIDSVVRERSTFVTDTLGLQLQLPDFLTEKDFEKGDIDVEVNEAVLEYLRTWFFKGEIAINRGRVFTPVFPLRNRLDTTHIHFNGNSFTIDRMGVQAGKSCLSASGSLKRLNIPGGKFFGTLDMDITSDRIDADELLLALNQGKQLRDKDIPDFVVENTEEADNLEVLIDSVTQQLPDTLMGRRLFVVPANLRSEIRMRFDSVSYSNLLIDTLEGVVVSKERCLQFCNWNATSNMGRMNLDAFYSTRTKKDISAGFNLGMYDITAQEVIGLIPMVDSVIPLLKTFKGDLGCEMTATCNIDTCMNLLLPTLNGVFKIGGENLRLEESAALRKIARLLLFRNKKTGEIDDMSLNGMISNSMMEIFPFILNIDRYTVALEGHQELSQPFEYYLSVISSPLPFQFGISLYGDNFDEWKYRIGPTKYTRSYYIPLFGDKVDSVQVNLATSIQSIFERGVDKVLRENAFNASQVDSLRAVTRDIPPVDEEKRKEFEEKYRKLEKQSFDE